MVWWEGISGLNREALDGIVSISDLDVLCQGRRAGSHIRKVPLWKGRQIRDGGHSVYSTQNVNNEHTSTHADKHFSTARRSPWRYSPHEVFYRV